MVSSANRRLRSSACASSSSRRASRIQASPRAAAAGAAPRRAVLDRCECHRRLARSLCRRRRAAEGRQPAAPADRAARRPRASGRPGLGALDDGASREHPGRRRRLAARQDEGDIEFVVAKIGGRSTVVEHGWPKDLENLRTGCVNVHGHEHAFKPLRRGRWINVSVEQTLYRPLDVRTQIIPLAKALVARRIPPGLTTAERVRHARLAGV